MRIFFAITVLALATGVRTETCPPQEDINPCECAVRNDNGELVVACATPSRVGDKAELKRILSSFSGKTVARMILKYLTLGRVPSDFFNGIRIRQLEIESCRIETLADGGLALRGLEDTLEILKIIKSFRGGQIPVKLQLGHLKRLEILILYYNDIKEVGDDWFHEGPISLQHLALTENNIEKIGSNAFANLANLKYLYLYSNELGQVQRSMFPSPAFRLDTLHLEDNELTELPEDIFTGMPVLRIVDLERNEIKTLDERVWGRVWKQLDWIYLSGNPLRCDDSMRWLFNMNIPHYFNGECDSPEEVNGKELEDFIKSGRE